MGRRRGDNQDKDADDLDARVEALQQTVGPGKLLGVQRMFHGGEKTGQSALKKVHASPRARVTREPHMPPTIYHLPFSWRGSATPNATKIMAPEPNMADSA